MGDKTEEGQELRALIRAYIEQEKMPIRVTRSTTNKNLLDEIEKMLYGGNSFSSQDDLPYYLTVNNSEDFPKIIYL